MEEANQANQSTDTKDKIAIFIKEHNCEQFENAINTAMDNGYIPCGGHQTLEIGVYTWYSQLMVKHWVKTG